jgi:two-component system chemotaxis sensor kinase CheA
MPDGMDEIIDDFIIEAEESLEKIDPAFVELESKGYDKELLNDIFRSMHTIKGAAGFLGFQSVVDVAHKTESLIKRLRDNEIEISSPLISLILRSVDMLKVLLGQIRETREERENVEPLVDELVCALGGDFHETAAHKLTEKSAPPEAADSEAQEIPEQDIAVAPVVTPETLNIRSEEIVTDDSTPGPAPKPQAEKGPAVTRAQTLRVDVDRIDKVMNLTGEIVLVRNRLLNISHSLESRYSTDSDVEGLQEAVSFLDLVTADMQLAVMKMRMQPIKKVFSKFPRLVRDISQGLGKDVMLNISGEDTEVDRTVIEIIGDPLVHIIRNSIDHGIESPEKRTEKGKPARGIVDISAYQQGNQIIIEVADDGKGIDSERVKMKAVEKGLVTTDDVDKMTDKEASGLIFHPGFSTMDKATELSGRGVGMDVVKTNISKLNGYVEVLSTKDVGTTLRISIPLTLAIIQALMVREGGVQYAIPLVSIEETLKISKEDVDNVTGNKVLAIRDKVLHLAELSELLGSYVSEEQKESRYVVVMTVGDRKYCLSVDELLGQEEVVIKNIEGIDTDMTGILGATITGEGKIVLILDPLAVTRAVLGIATV